VRGGGGALCHRLGIARARVFRVRGLGDGLCSNRFKRTERSFGEAGGALRWCLSLVCSFAEAHRPHFEDNDDGRRHCDKNTRDDDSCCFVVVVGFVVTAFSGFNKGAAGYWQERDLSLTKDPPPSQRGCLAANSNNNNDDDDDPFVSCFLLFPLVTDAASTFSIIVSTIVIAIAITVVVSRSKHLGAAVASLLQLRPSPDRR
jgi:hypothetical protein